MPRYFTEDPVESLRQNWWINPFWEDDVQQVSEIMGTDHVILEATGPILKACQTHLIMFQNSKHFRLKINGESCLTM